MAAVTKIERKLRAEFRRRGLHFGEQAPMFGRFKCDFIFPRARLIVEADGWPWHMWRDHESLYTAARKRGWEVWRFPERLIVSPGTRCQIGELVEFYVKKTV